MTRERYRCLDGSLRPTEDERERIHDFDTEVTGIVEPGHGVASGRNVADRYPEGSIAMQYPHFKSRGLDLGRYFPGTLNVSIAPATFFVHSPWYRFDDVLWAKGYHPESFSIARCCVAKGGLTLRGIVYYPDPSTKTEHRDDPSHLQIIAPFLPGVRYGEAVTMHLRSDEVSIIGPNSD
jgi:hypothetical protein